MATIGFFGAGNMGFGMASRLIKAGHTVRIYNRTEAKALPLVKLGATFCSTPRQAASEADVLISMVGDDIASRNIWLGDEGALSTTLSKKVLAIECSTLSHDWVMALSEKIKSSGLVYLDCPVTGLPDAALKGELTLFLGGDQTTIKRAQPFLTPLSTRQVHFGNIGSGTAYKLIVNLMGSIQIVATAEGLLAAQKAGLDLNIVAHELGAGGCGSPQVARNAHLMAEGQHDKEVVFNAYWRRKDTQYGIDFAAQMGQPNSLGIPTRAAFEKLIEAGFGELAESKVIDILRTE